MTALDGVNGTVCNVEQYQQSQQLQNIRSSSISCLTRGDAIGIVLRVEASMLSCICVIVIFIWIGCNVRWYKKTYPTGNWRLFRGPADIYMFSLFAFDTLQAVGGILSIRWAHNGIITTGHYCTAQGLIEQIGELGVALITLLLTVHTFVAAVLNVGLKARGVAFAMVCLACVFITLWAAIGATIHKNYDTPQPYWCWISPHYPGIRLGGEYVWLWIALFASTVLNIPLYFWAEGFWWIDKRFRFHWEGRRVEFGLRRATLGMLFYPLAYSLIVLPISITRWSSFNHHQVPPAAMFFANSVFYLSGAINVLLFLIIRPGLLLFSRPRVQVEEFAGPQIELAEPE